MKVRNRIMLGCSVAAALMVTGSLGAVPTAMVPSSVHLMTALATCTLTLTTSPASPQLGQSVTLTATYSCAMPSGYWIDILDSTGHNYVSTYPCYSNPCSGLVSGPPTAQSNTFTAYVDDNYPPAGVIATSSSVTVSWSSPPCCSISLTANTTSPSATNPLTLTMTASPSLPYEYEIDLYEDGGGYRVTCLGSPCTYQPPAEPGTHSWIAHLNSYGYSSSTPLATSATVTVTWLYPSQSCLAPTIPPLSGDDFGVKYLFSVQATSNPTVVCFRIDGGPGAVLGGAVELNPGQLPAVPIVVPGHAADCWTTASPPNQLPLHHPWLRNSAGNVVVTADAYASGQQVWACLQVTNGGMSVVDEKVILNDNVGLPNATAAFDPDSV